MKLFFSVILKHFRGNLKRTSLFSPKNDPLRKERRNTQKKKFLTRTKGPNPEEKLDLFKQLFLIKPVKWEKCKNLFFSPKLQHTAKLCFSVVLWHFRGNLQRTSFFSQKSGYFRKEH